MMKKFLMSAAVSLSLASSAFAGDTVTITAPGGAGQTVGPGVIAAAITRATGLPVSSVSNMTPGGDITVVAGGNTYVVTSGFIAMLLAYYS
ncbi:hypothetical protein HLM50_17610 [Sulfitobacter sp. Ks41]|uniref:hypothetical protein n=1 Tax=unclassified Sulfitobacter TaxID=196795 RepID=UPI0023E25049|nr:hypothetical protein [Sulfitobacter sp. Ks41]MDF3362867.1 hypothetical protein [Sulfitobacter sp. Ks41]|tara:strand:- start:23086 stop:23358 length:273 start_codon:yes stop_codon:yes gene_type:complete